MATVIAMTLLPNASDVDNLKRGNIDMIPQVRRTVSPRVCYFSNSFMI